MMCKTLNEIAEIKLNWKLNNQKCEIKINKLKINKINNLGGETSHKQRN